MLSTAELRLEVRAFAAASAHASFFSMSAEISPWHAVSGIFPTEVLEIIHNHVDKVPLSLKQKRYLTTRQQLSKLRGDHDALVAAKEATDVSLLTALAEPARLTRLLEHAEAKLVHAVEDAKADAISTAEGVAKETARVHKQPRREVIEERESGASAISMLQGEIRGERSALGDKITALQVLITELETNLRRAQAALRMRGAQADRAEAEVAAKMAELSEGRIRTKLRAEEARAELAEQLLKEARGEIARQAAELRARNGISAAERQELSHLRYEKKRYQEKVAAYQVKSNRKFFEVEPLMEEVETLREQIAQLRSEIAAEVAERRATARTLRSEMANLEAVVCPPYSKFYQCRGKTGGVMISDDWHILTMTLATLSIPAGSRDKAVISIAEFFGLHLLHKRVTVNCRKQGVKKLAIRCAVPGISSSAKALEVGGELADLMTYVELAQAKSFGFTFDGATINMYGVFGGGVCIENQQGQVVRRMAFGEMMTRETVTNKIRKMREFFARGKASLELLDHPLASHVKFERASGATSDRGGADGKVSNQIEREIIESVKREMGRKAWDGVLDVDAKFIAVCDAWGESDDVVDVWAQAKARHDDIELDRHAVDPEYSPQLFNTLSETTQEVWAAIQLIGHLEYVRPSPLTGRSSSSPSTASSTPSPTQWSPWTRAWTRSPGISSQASFQTARRRRRRSSRSATHPATR